MSTRAGASVVVFVLAACSGSEARTPSALETDRWVATEPVLTIGSVDRPEHAFQRVNRIAIAPDGTIFSLHAGEAQLRRWTAEGAPLEAVGREGEGPGEFQAPRSLGFFGDTLWVWDGGRAFRASYFTIDGAFLDSTSPSVNLGSRDPNEERYPPRPDRPLRAGGFLGSTPAFSDAIARGQLGALQWVRFDSAGTITDTVWIEETGPTDVLALLRDGGGTFLPHPYGEDDLATFDESDGSLVVVDRRAWDGRGSATFRVTRISVPSGDTLLQVPVPYEARALPSEEADSVASAMSEQFHPFIGRREAGLTVAALTARIAEAMHRPAFVPPVTELLLAADGRILLKPFDQPEDGDLWWVFDREVRPLGRIRTVPGARLMAVESDAVWGVITDDLDVNYIVKYSLVE